MVVFTSITEYMLYERGRASTPFKYSVKLCKLMKAHWKHRDTPLEIRTPLLLFPSLFLANPIKYASHQQRPEIPIGHYNTTEKHYASGRMSTFMKISWSVKFVFEMSHSAFSTFQQWEEAEKSISPSFSSCSEESHLHQNINNATDVRNVHNKIRTKIKSLHILETLNFPKTKQ